MSNRQEKKRRRELKMQERVLKSGDTLVLSVNDIPVAYLTENSYNDKSYLNTVIKR